MGWTDAAICSFSLVIFATGYRQEVRRLLTRSLFGLKRWANPLSHRSSETGSARSTLDLGTPTRATSSTLISPTSPSSVLFVPESVSPSSLALQFVVTLAWGTEKPSSLFYSFKRRHSSDRRDPGNVVDAVDPEEDGASHFDFALLPTVQGERKDPLRCRPLVRPSRLLFLSAVIDSYASFDDLFEQYVHVHRRQGYGSRSRSTTPLVGTRMVHLARLLLLCRFVHASSRLRAWPYAR